jgi:hypothetical protein
VEWLLGEPLPAARLLATFAAGMCAAVLLRFGQVLLGSRPAGVVAAATCLVATAGRDGLTLTTELIDNALVGLTAFLLLRVLDSPGERSHDRWCVAAAGLALGMSLQVKFIDLPHILLLGGAFLWLAGRDSGPASWLEAAGLLLAGVSLPSLAALLYFWWHGALALLLDASVGANVSYLAGAPVLDDAGRDLVAGLAPIGGLVACAALLGWRGAWSRTSRHARLWLLLWLVASALATCMPLRFWRHHFHLLLPPACLCCGLAATWLADRLFHRRHGRAVAALALLLALPTIRSTWMDWMWLRSVDAAAAPRRVAAEILRRGSDGRDLYVACDQAILYVLTGTKPPRQMFWTYQMEQSGPAAERLAPGADAAGHVLAGLAAGPRYLVTEAGVSHAALAAALPRYDLVLEAPGGTGVASTLLYVRR